LLLVADLLFFLFRSSKQSTAPTDGNETLRDRYRRMTRVELLNSFVSLLLYLAQISWLIYGNYIYFNMPVDIPGLAYNENPVDQSGEASETGQISGEEIDSEKWLYVALMSVLTIGYVHIMLFLAFIIVLLIYSITSCCFGSDRVQHFSPVKLWLFIDEGIFSLLDELEDVDVDPD